MYQKKQASLANEIKRYRIPRLGNHSQQIICPGCYKIFGRPNIDFKDCMNYIVLRDNQCDKNKALIFCTKKRCKFDTTQLQCNGPPTCRVIKIKESAIKYSMNGWSFGNEMQYDVGQPDDVLIDNRQQKMYDLQDSYLAKQIQHLNQHIDDQMTINRQHSYNLRNLTRNQLLDKLKFINQMSPQSSPINSPQKQTQIDTIQEPNSNSCRNSMLEAKNNMFFQLVKRNTKVNNLKKQIQNSIKGNTNTNTVVTTPPKISTTQLFKKPDFRDSNSTLMLSMTNRNNKESFFTQECDSRQEVSNIGLNALLSNRSKAKCKEIRRFQTQSHLIRRDQINNIQ